MIIVLGFALFVAAISYRNNEKNKKLIGIISAQKHELEIAVQTKDRIFSLISHDMRAPVSTMIAFTQLLEYDEVPQENLRKYTIQLKKSLNHTSVLIDNLLNWSSSQMQGFKPFLEICDIGLLVTDVISTLQAQASAKKIVIVNNIPLGMLITADINMAQLVLRNLISNAVKFSYEDGAIDLNAKAYGDKVELSVYDKGMGMSEELVEQFNTNSQLQFVESTLGTHKEKGTGLGLVLCKNFTTLMQGEIFVESQEGQGTTCYVALPNGS